MFSSLTKLTFKTAEYLIKGKVLNKKEGAKFLNQGEAKSFLSTSHKGLLLDGVDKRLSPQDSFQNVCIVGKSGQNKTTTFNFPIIFDKASQKASLVVHDPKGEAYKNTSGYMEAQGYRVVVFNPHNVEESNLFNPLIEARSEIELENIATTLIWSGNPSTTDPHWNNGATKIIKPLLKCLSFGDKKYFNLPNLYRLLQNFGQMGDGLENWVSANCWNPQYPNDPYVLDEWKAVLSGNVEGVHSCLDTALIALRSLSSRNVRLFYSKSDYSLSHLRKEKTIIYFVTPSQMQKYYASATSLFFNAVFNECMRDEHLDSKNSLPVYLIYDEFGNSYISDFLSVANTIRGYNVSLSIILQSLSQLITRYGKEGESIKEAFNTHICLAGADYYSCDYFSKISGRVRETQTRGNITDPSNLNTDYREYNLINPAEIRTMNDGEVLLVSKNRQPLKLNATPYFNYRKFNKASQFPHAFVKKQNIHSNIDLVDL